MKRTTDQEFLRSLQSIGDPRKIKTENIRRSDHNDFATSSELRERSFSGWRHNQVSREMEMWINGKLVGICKVYDDPSITKQAMQALAEEVLAL